MTYLKILPWHPLKEMEGTHGKKRTAVTHFKIKTGYILNEIPRVQTHFRIRPDFIGQFAVLVHVTIPICCPLP